MQAKIDHKTWIEDSFVFLEASPRVTPRTILATFPEIEPALALVVTEMRTEMAQEVTIDIDPIPEQVVAVPG